MTLFQTTLHEPPRGKERPRASIPWPWVEKWLRSGKRGPQPIPRVYTRSEYRGHEDRLADLLAAAWGEAGHSSALDEPCSVSIVAWFPRPRSRTRKTLPNPRYPHTVRPDGDNVGKAVLDAMQKAGMLHDDSRVFALRVVKWVCSADCSPRIEVTLSWDFDTLPE